MSPRSSAYIVGAFEHPTRKAPDKSVAQLHAEVRERRLGRRRADQGRRRRLFLRRRRARPRRRCRWSTTSASSCATSIRPTPAARPTCIHVAPCRRGHRRRQVQRRADHAGGPAAQRRHGDRHRAARRQRGAARRRVRVSGAPTTANMYAMCAMRHMHEFGTTSEQLAWIKVAASHHAQHNPHAMLRERRDGRGGASSSPMIADPLHRLDCCVISDGGGALIVTRAGGRQEPRRGRWSSVIGAGEALEGTDPAATSISPISGAALVGHGRVRGGRRDAAPTSSTPRSTTASRSPC